MSSQSEHRNSVGHGIGVPGAPTPDLSGGHHSTQGGPPPISNNSRPLSSHLGPPPIPESTRPASPSQYPPLSPHGSYPPPSGPPPGQYYQPPIGAPQIQPFYPPPQGPPGGYPPYMPPPQSHGMPMPGPFASAPQNVAYPPAPQFPGSTSSYHPNYNQWYLGTEIPPVHPQPAPHGMLKVPGYDPKGDAQAITNATKGRSLDKKEKEMLIKTLVPLSALQMDALADHYQQMTRKTLLGVLPNLGMFNDYFGMGIHALAAGPIVWDVELVGKALAPGRVGSLGTDEALLNELLLDRPTSDIRLLTAAYRQKHGESKGNLIKEVKADLSLDTAHMFELALDPSRPDDSINDPAEIKKDVDALFHGGRGRTGKEKLYEILVKRSRSHTLEMITEYDKAHGKLAEVIKRQYSGHMREGLLYIVNGAEHHLEYGPGVWRDAQLLYNAMEGRGTADKQLVTRIVRAHWDWHRMSKIKGAYRQIAKEDLSKRIHSETSGAYRSLLIAIVDGPETLNK